MTLTPLENPNLYGHDEAEAALLRLLDQHRLPHALLFCGLEGIGKATLAYRLAKYLLVGEQAAPEPVMGLFGPEPVEAPHGLGTPPDAPAIRRMIAGSHGDFLVVQPLADDKRKTSVDTIFIEQIREVIDFMHHTPSESDWRVVIVDPAEAMNTAAANALLKVLEEPPPQALLLLISHQPGKLLPTIKSRCRRIMLPPPDAASCERIASNLPADELHALLQLTQASPGRALRYAEQNALEIYAAILAALADTSPRSQAAFAAKAAKAGAESWPVYRALLLQALYRLSRAATAPLPALNAEESAIFTKLLQRQPLGHWLQMWEKAETMLAEIHSLTLDKQQVLLSLLWACGGGLRAA